MSGADTYNKIISTINSVTTDYQFIPDVSNIITIDTSNNRIGIGTLNPETSLHIKGSSDSGIITTNLEISSGRFDLYGDASLNANVDVSGDLILKGSFGVLNSSTNDISYGTSGSVLTSNGFGNSLSWKEPVYYSAYLTNSITNDYNIETDITNLTVDTTNGSFFNSTSGIFTAPRSGVYNVSYTAHIEDPSANTRLLSCLQIFLNIKYNNSASFSQYMMCEYTNTQATIENYSITLNTLIELNTGDQIKNSVLASPQDGPYYIINGGIPRKTFQSVYIIN